ncbi:MAG: Rpn family recombination-promoting nuclease/putative transposase, partial [Treponema sp.]|nr:Rpn family recombination-promoting nuclease/putative transposase [Treponema sp.]
MGANSRYKDSVFSLLFARPDVLRELYSAIAGIPLDPDIPIEINTLQDAVFKGKINDISFSIGTRLVVLIEHQSTINPNMPVRLLMY